jgi:hypothetical protein
MNHFTSLWLIVYVLGIYTVPNALSFAPPSTSNNMIRHSVSTSSALLSRRLRSRILPIGLGANSRISSSSSVTKPNYDRIRAQYLSTMHATVVDQEESSTSVLESSETSTSLSSSSNEETNPLVNGKKDEVLDDEDTTLLDLEGLKSRPKKGGNWKPTHPLDWAKDYGRRSPEDDKRLQSLIQLKPGDEGYYDVSEIQVPKVTQVRTREDAKIVMEILMNADDPSIFHACDTEVMDIQLKEVGPVGNGYVTCASIYSGPDFDYGLGDGPGTSLWIDNLDDACGVLQEFKPWFEDHRFLKVWHNYGFDRHVMWNEGIDCQGFGGDTMHMARLQDTSRAKYGLGLGYSLEALTGELLGRRKQPMKEIFGVARLRMDGSPGQIMDVPPIDVLQRDPSFRENFIKYSCYDAEGTWGLHQKLVEMLKEMAWLSNGKNLYDYYFENMREFGHVLTDMERRGIRVDAKDYLASVEIQARKDRQEHLQKFREWAAIKIGPDGLALNPASSVQLGTLIFGGAQNQKTKEVTETRRVFKVAREEIPDNAMEAYKKRDEKAQSKNTSKCRFSCSIVVFLCFRLIVFAATFSRRRTRDRLS